MLQVIIEKFFTNLNSKLIDSCKNNNNYLQNKVFVIGLGSGSTVGMLVEKLAELQKEEKELLGFIPTSFQIKIIAEQSGLRFLDESKITDINLVVDGADQIDENLNMIKGGGGALFKEKILIQSAKEKIILADSQKYVSSFTIPVPVEVHPFARSAVSKKLEDIGGRPNIRFLKKGYPYITENGNMILDTQFDDLQTKEISAIESKIKNIPGVIEVGIFSSTKNTIYYSIKDNGTFSTRVC
jgi:ribose 5-phosphate isomerase A